MTIYRIGYYYQNKDADLHSHESINGGECNTFEISLRCRVGKRWLGKARSRK